jgi:hypothetical protein
MKGPRVGSLRITQPVGLLDLCDPRIQRYIGRKVRGVQPHGSPPNGTMGHCHVRDVKTKAFVGLVLCTSLQRPKLRKGA